MAARTPSSTTPLSDEKVARLAARMAEHWPEALKPEMPVVVRAMRLGRILQEETEISLRPLGLGFRAFEVLVALRSCPPPHRMLPSELYDAVLISSGGLTKVLKALEAEGLVRRREGEGDARRKPVELTAAGRRKAEAALKAVSEHDTRALAGAGISAKGYQTLARQLSALTESIERHGHRAAGAGPADPDDAATKS